MFENPFLSVISHYSYIKCTTYYISTYIQCTLIKEGLDDASEAEIKMGMEGWMDV